jgi:hypothetical protein
MSKKRSFLILLVALLAGVRLAAQVAWADSIDSAMLTVVRPVLRDSLRGAGARGNQLTIASDSASAVILRAAQLSISAAPGDGVACPAGTLGDGTPVAEPVGYRVSVQLSRDPESRVWVLSVSKSCTFSYRGRQRGFRESGSWELVRQDGRWILGRSRGRSVT